MATLSKIIEALNEYKALKITKKQLHEKVGKKFWDVQLDEDDIVIVDNNDLIYVLQAAKDGRISIPELIDWVNVIWFSELYDYSDEHEDVIAAVMNELEELEDTGYVLPVEDIDLYISALEKNDDEMVLKRRHDSPALP